MKITAQNTERIHSLDSIRAIMMILGLVLHSAVTYAETPVDTWKIKDPNTSHIIHDFIIAFLHTFRMPIFFIVAGFFGSLLFYNRNPRKMLKNRVNRIVKPFIIFLIILNPIIIFSFLYTDFLFSAHGNPLVATLANFKNPLILIPQMTYHLWFLYYLALITFGTVGIAIIVKKIKIETGIISIPFRWIMKSLILRIIILSVSIYCIFILIGTYNVLTPTSFIPKVKIFIFYFFFYIIGWILFKSKDLISHLTNDDWICFMSGVIIFSALFFLSSHIPFSILLFINSLMVSLLIFGIMGLFIRYGSNHSHIMRYISDSSYWVYLIHLVLTAIIPGLIFNWDLPAPLKFLIVLTSTTVICFFSYHFLVRKTFIGEFLNGKRYTKYISDSDKYKIKGQSIQN